jgi:hypothetical protein
MDSPQAISRIAELLSKYKAEKSWGTITIEFRGGDPCYIKSETTEKLPSATKEALAHGRPEYRTQR